MATERFEFHERVHGAGGFAKVIKGHDRVLERDVAVKVLNQLATQFDEAERERFKREAKILAKLSHPNVPSIYDVSFDEDEFLIIFEFIEGTTLRQLLDDEGPCDLSNARRWFAQIASALGHAHDNSVVHRDIKPENIIITPNRETAYLVDFGIALTTDEAKRLTKSGFAIGTPGYMSPEQMAGESVDERSDIYSLAVTLYEALAGKPGAPLAEYEELSVANEAIPPQVDDLIRECCLPKEQRVASVTDFSTRLAGALRPSKPLSEVLGQGRLHEIAAALDELQPEQFAKLPPGQPTLVLAKLDDIVESEEPRLEYAAARFLEVLVVRGLLLPDEDYRQIVKPAIEWGYKRKIGDHLGRAAIRRELEKAAHGAPRTAHKVLREEFHEFIRGEDLQEKHEWWLHAARVMLQALLANPACDQLAKELGSELKRINKVQRGR
jgi:serine/threonine-protein kinase